MNPWNTKVSVVAAEVGAEPWRRALACGLVDVATPVAEAICERLIKYKRYVPSLTKAEILCVVTVRGVQHCENTRLRENEKTLRSRRQEVVICGYA